MRIFPIEAKIFKVKEAQVIVIKNKSINLLMKKCFMPYGMKLRRTTRNGNGTGLGRASL